MAAVTVDQSRSKKEPATPEEDSRRQKLQQQLYEHGMRHIENRKSMTLYSADEKADEWVYQQVLDDGIVTLAQRYVQGITPKRAIGFGYDIAKFFSRMADGRVEFTELRDDGHRITHHQRMITPWIISNRSIYVTTYHMHDEDLENGPYTLIRSSQGNDAISDANVEMTGEDVEADMILFMLNVMPIREGLSRVRFIIHINLGGGLPGPLRQKISSKQVDFIDMLAKICNQDTADIDASFEANKERILANVAKQKVDMEAAEQKRLRKEQRKKEKLEAKNRELQDQRAAEAAAGVNESEYFAQVPVVAAQDQPERLILPEQAAVAKEDAEFEDGDYMGGMTERNIHTARKLIPDTKVETAQKVENEDEPVIIEPAINHVPDTPDEAVQAQEDQCASLPRIELNFVDSDDSSAMQSRFEVQKPKDPREVIQTAIAATSQPMKITWENVKFSVELQKGKYCGKKHTKTLDILKGCTGSAMPGQATFIMGASGAGKTSLLNIISDRTSHGRGNQIQGNILINDKTKLTQSNFGSYGAYVMQDDILFQYFTVEEAFLFAARLKLDTSVPMQNRRAKQLMKELGLWEIRTTLVGGPMMKTISGGERKRVAIGVEMITDPQIVLLDEPTSGLDSFRAFSIVKFLQQQARKGKTVIATIHQPSSDSYINFDKLILMCDGHIVFQGPPQDVPNYFAQVDIPFKKFANPADVAMKELAINYPKTQANDDLVKKLLTAYNERLRDKDKKLADEFQLGDIDIKAKKEVSCCHAFRQLCKRNVQSIKRNPLVFKARFGQLIFMGLLCMAVYFDANGPEKKQLQNLVGAMFFMAMATFMPAYMMTGLTFQTERPVFLREQANKMYGVLPYYLAKILSDLPSFIVPPTLFTIITFFGIGFTRSTEQFFIFLLNASMSVMAGVSFGYLISSTVKNQVAAMQLAPVIIMPLMLVGGFYVNQEEMPLWLVIFSAISPFKYCFNNFVRSEFDASPYPLAKVMLQFLDIQDSVFMGLAYQGILIFTLQISSVFFLKLLVDRFQ